MLIMCMDFKQNRFTIPCPRNSNILRFAEPFKQCSFLKQQAHLAVRDRVKQEYSATLPYLYISTHTVLVFINLT